MTPETKMPRLGGIDAGSGEAYRCNCLGCGRDSTHIQCAVNTPANLRPLDTGNCRVSGGGATRSRTKTKCYVAERVGMKGSNATRPRNCFASKGVRGFRGHEQRADMTQENKRKARKAVQVRKRVAYHLQMDCRHLSNRDVSKVIVRQTGWIASAVGLTHAEIILKYWHEVMGGSGSYVASASPPKSKKTYRAIAQEFYASDEWRKARYSALQVCGGKCQCCGASARDGVRIHVDHIKPRFTHPHLQLEVSNLQVLCEDCNLGKGARDSTDWRTEEQRMQLEHMKTIGGVQ